MHTHIVVPRNFVSQRMLQSMFLYAGVFSPGGVQDDHKRIYGKLLNVTAYTANFFHELLLGKEIKTERRMYAFKAIEFIGCEKDLIELKKPEGVLPEIDYNDCYKIIPTNVVDHVCVDKAFNIIGVNHSSNMYNFQRVSSGIKLKTFDYSNNEIFYVSKDKVKFED